MKIKRNFIKWFAFLFALICFLSAIPFSAIAAEAQTPNVIVPDLMSKTTVEDDLEELGIDITDYPKDLDADYSRLLYFLEYGYDYSGYHGCEDQYCECYNK